MNNYVCICIINILSIIFIIIVYNNKKNIIIENMKGFKSPYKLKNNIDNEDIELNNIIINNYFFNKYVQKFFKKFNNDKDKLYCDIDFLNVYNNYENCYIINQLENNDIYGDKYTYYDILKKIIIYQNIY